MNEELLINIVRNYPHLYLMSDQNYHNYQMKENAWEEISGEIKIPVLYEFEMKAIARSTLNADMISNSTSTSPNDVVNNSALASSEYSHPESPPMIEKQLLHLMGEDCYDIYLSLADLLNTPEGSPTRTNFEIAKTKLNTYFKPKTNIDFEIFKFREAKQEHDETVDQFYARLLQLSKTCQFNNANNEIKGQIILSTNNEELRKFALNEQPDLDQLLNKAKTLELTATQLKPLEEKNAALTSSINKIHKNNYNNRNNYNKSNNHQNNTNQQVKTMYPNTQRICKNCGNNWHKQGRQPCPAINSTCYKSNKQGHFTKTSLSSKQNTNNKSKHSNKVHYTEQYTTSDESESVYLTTTINNINNNLPTATVKINKKDVKYIIDTGSSVNIISEQIFKHLNINNLLPDKSSIYPYKSNNKLEILGKFSCTIQHNNTKTLASVKVIKGKGESLLSFDTARELNLVELHCNNINKVYDLEIIKQTYPSICNGTGNLKGTEIELYIDQSIAPVVQTNRRIPFHFRKQVEQEINNLLKENIVEEAEGPTPWVSPVVIVPKPHNKNEIRLCVDMRQPNKRFPLKVTSKIEIIGGMLKMSVIVLTAAKVCILQITHFDICGVLLVDELVANERNVLYVLHQRTLRDTSNPQLFRFNKEVARVIINMVQPHMREVQRVTFIPPHIKILTSLSFYASGSYQLPIGHGYNFAMSQPSVSRCIDEMTQIIYQHLLPQWINFPQTHEERLRVRTRFVNNFNFPQCIGATDCTHIAIISPPEQYPALPYYSRKGYYSINCQIISDSDYKILNMNARFPGSTHDSAIWQASGIRRIMEESYINGENSILIGDAGYPLQPFLLTPIENAEQNTPEGNYNYHLIRARNVIEKVNGVLKGRFRCLLQHRVLHYDPIKAGKIIYSASF
ncbi:hypothetical protein FQR65_LT14553 [Abscondita terminalis]|nr:hypothetical protein FQR65_LT14553 [Abscondita terminalis]